MRNTYYILVLLILHQNLLSQTEIIGDVEIYKSYPNSIKRLESSSDGTIKNLNSKRHKVKIIQGKSISEIETDTTGLFKFQALSKDTIHIIVNEKSRVFNKRFSFNHSEMNDTIELRISDKKLAAYRDSIQVPKFFKKYNEKQAILDFRNGRKRILGSGLIFDETIQRRKKLSEKYGFEYDYIRGCMVMVPELRIMYRYNQVMKELIGIENVW